MSGKSEIWSWIEDRYNDIEWEKLTDQEIYNYMNSLFVVQGRSSLDQILGNDKEIIFKMMERKRRSLTKILERIITVSGYSYIRNGRTINVPGYERRYRIVIK